MRRLLGVSIVLLTMLGFAFVPASAQEVGGGSSGQQDFELKPNYPNPFNPETNIPFVLSERLFEDGRPVVVSIRIYNLLKQPVASPVAKDHPSGDGLPLVNLEYTRPGEYEAFWDGRDASGRPVASGPYWCQITVNGRSDIIRMFVTK
ncbi:hypothetical protein [Gaopeijia maritima]|uniref:FlgD Ig-like domain-containing protein n=1 Tax=Gaopeijia maritima TaxID=3119007 RepID=A0ABU9E8Z4_9BACT